MADKPKQPEIKPISVKEWRTGIAESQFIGFAELRGMDVITHPGTLALSPKNSSCGFTSQNGTFTANASTDILTGPSMVVTVFGTGYTGIQAATFTTTGTLPAPLATSTVYYISSSGGGTTYKVSTTLANANSNIYIDITTTGSGTHTINWINPGYINAFATDPGGGNAYGVDNNGRIWQLNGSFLWYLVTGNTLTGVSDFNGLAVFKNYLLSFRNGAIDTYGPLNGSPSWTNSWQSLLGSSLGQHPTLVGQDDILYWGDDDNNNGMYLGSLQQVAGKTFTPSDATTYTYTTKALTLPTYKQPTCLAELGVNLMTGTSGREIYPWDRTSATFNLPIICPETYVYSMQNAGNQLYIAAGNKGNLYLFNGYLVVPKKIFPKQLLANDANTAIIRAMCVVGRKLLYTVSTVGQSGIYSLDLVTDAISMENMVSAGYVGSPNGIRMNALLSRGNYYFSSWGDLNNSGNTGIDVSSDGGTARYLDTTDFNNGTIGYAMTPNMDIGFFNEPRTLQYVEVYLDRPLVTGHRVVVYYRTSQSASFTLLATFVGDNVNQVFQTNAATISGTDVQFKVALVGNSSTTPLLQELRIL